MKTHPLISLTPFACAVALFAASLVTSIDGAAPYETSDNFAPDYAYAVVADPATNLFVAGRDGSGAIIRRLATPTQP